MLRRVLPGLAVLLLWALPSGCAHFAPTAAERSATFGEFANARVGSEKLEDYIKRRVGFVSAGLVLTRIAEMPGGSLRFQGYSLEKTFNIGTATAIDRRGYFLTASHVVTKGPVYVGWLEPAVHGEPVLRDCPARVVWRGDVRRGEPDIALLCVDCPLPAAFTWAAGLRRGERVISAGLDYGDEKRPESDLSVTILGGVIKRAPDRGPPPGGRITILHTTPVHEGDSGGPLADLNGRLIAVNDGYAYVFPYLPLFHTYRAYSHRPNLGWLRGRIDRDLVRRGALQAVAGARVAGAEPWESSITLRTRSISKSSLNGLGM
ncbi:MAG: S1 family peptidase [Opitutaceae bacterium]